MRKTLTQTLLAAFCAILACATLEGGGVMVLGARMAAWAGAGGIRRIGSVKSDGTAYTVVRRVTENVNAVKIRMIVCGPGTSGSYQDVNGKNIFGYSKNDSRWCLNNYNAGGSWSKMEFQLYSSGFVGGIRWTRFNDGDFHEMVFERSGNSVSMHLDGLLVLNKTGTTTTPIQGRLGIFTQNDREGDAVGPIANRVPKGVSIASFKVWEGGELVTDLQPAIAPDNEICFYDAAIGDYARNLAGSGSFIAGPEA